MILYNLKHNWYLCTYYNYCIDFHYSIIYKYMIIKFEINTKEQPKKIHKTEAERETLKLQILR